MSGPEHNPPTGADPLVLLGWADTTQLLDQVVHAKPQSDALPLYVPASMMPRVREVQAGLNESLVQMPQLEPVELAQPQAASPEGMAVYNSIAAGYPSQSQGAGEAVCPLGLPIHNLRIVANGLRAVEVVNKRFVAARLDEIADYLRDIERTTPPASQCDEEWGPTCDLGNNPAHVKVARQPSSQQAVPDDAPENFRTEVLPRQIGGGFAPITMSAVRVTHIPTGASAESYQARSQHKNRQIAFDAVCAMLRAAQGEAP